MKFHHRNNSTLLGLPAMTRSFNGCVGMGHRLLVNQIPVFPIFFSGWRLSIRDDKRLSSPIGKRHTEDNETSVCTGTHQPTNGYKHRTEDCILCIRTTIDTLPPSHWLPI